MNTEKVPINDYLLSAAAHAPAADNIKPWKISFFQNEIRIDWDSSKSLEFGFSMTHPATLLSVGALIENIEQACDSINQPFEVKIQSLVDLEKYKTYAIINLINGNSGVHIKNFQHPLFLRKTSRSPFKLGHLDFINENTINGLIQSLGITVNILSEPMDIKKIAKLIGLASEIRFQIKDCHQWLMHSLNFNKISPSEGGLNIHSLGLPRIAEITLQFLSTWNRMKLWNWLGGYRIMARFEAEKAKKAGTYLAFSSKDDMTSLIHCGQAMERVWIHLNQKSVKVHPYFVITDIESRLKEGSLPPKLVAKAKSIADGLTAFLKIEDHKRSIILLRVGM